MFLGHGGTVGAEGGGNQTTYRKATPLLVTLGNLKAQQWK